MRPLFGIFILIFILFFHEIAEASVLLKRIFTQKKSSDDAEDARAVSIHGTSRLTMHSTPTYNPTAIGHQALDLHRYQSDIQESSHQQEAADLVNRFKKNKLSPSKCGSSTRTIQNHQIQHQHRKLANIDWLIQHFQNGAPPVFQSGNSNELTQMPSMGLEGNPKTNPNDGNSNKASSSKGVSSSRRIQNNQIQDPNDFHTLTAPDSFYPPTQSQKNALYLHESHQKPNVPDVNNPVNTPEGPERRRSETKSINLNRNFSHDSPERQAYYAFVRGPMIQNPYSPSGQRAVDLFNQHYKNKAHPPPQSGENALELYKSHQNRNAPDLNKSIKIPEERGRRNSKTKTKGINLNKNVCHISAEVKASHEFVKQSITQLGPHSPLRAFEDKEEITPEQLKKQYESLKLYHKHYGYSKDPTYRKLFESVFGGSSSASGN